MTGIEQPESSGGRDLMRRMGVSLACALGLLATSCGRQKQELIAVIPQTDGMLLWDAAHAGAEIAASRTGSLVYWNAPMREDDVAAQVRLVNQVISGDRYQGLVIAPTQALSLVSPVRRALSRNIPTVIIDSPLSMPAGGKLSYILNDDEEAGRLAAERAAQRLHGKGTVALLGIDPDVLGVTTRARVFEETLTAKYPGVRIVEKRIGSFNVLRERQVVEELLASDPNIDVCVALLWTTLDGLFSAIDSLHSAHPPAIIGFDLAGDPPFDSRNNLDCVIQANTKLMGQRAVEQIHAMRQGESVSPVVMVKPVMITRENLHSAEVRQTMGFDWSLGRWSWSSTP
jgi:ribose transport system substrate-binding protein